MVPYPPQMPTPQPPRKSGMSGCLIALTVVGVVAVLGTCGAGVTVYLVATSKAGKATIKLVGGATKIAAEGASAPGTPELRALGCDPAMVMDAKEVADLLNDALDAGVQMTGAEGLLVTCQVPARSAAPTCDDVAKTYVRAVGRARADFTVNVQKQGEPGPVCETSYDPEGRAKGGI